MLPIHVWLHSSQTQSVLAISSQTATVSLGYQAVIASWCALINIWYKIHLTRVYIIIWSELLAGCSLLGWVPDRQMVGRSSGGQGGGCLLVAGGTPSFSVTAFTNYPNYTFLFILSFSFLPPRIAVNKVLYSQWMLFDRKQRRVWWVEGCEDCERLEGKYIEEENWNSWLGHCTPLA